MSPGGGKELSSASWGQRKGQAARAGQAAGGAAEMGKCWALRQVRTESGIDSKAVESYKCLLRSGWGRRRLENANFVPFNKMCLDSRCLRFDGFFLSVCVFHNIVCMEFTLSTMEAGTRCQILQHWNYMWL